MGVLSKENRRYPIASDQVSVLVKSPPKWKAPNYFFNDDERLARTWYVGGCHQQNIGKFHTVDLLALHAAATNIAAPPKVITIIIIIMVLKS